MEWSEVALVRCAVEDISDDPEPAFLNPDHPILRQFSLDEQADLKADLEIGFEDGLSLWQRFDEVSSSGEFVVALIALAYEHLGHFPSAHNEYEAYLEARSAELRAHWTRIATECGIPIEKLRVIATRGKREILLSPEAWIFRELGGGEASLLPPRHRQRLSSL
jgi:hypothetical protein